MLLFYNLIKGKKTEFKPYIGLIRSKTSWSKKDLEGEMGHKTLKEITCQIWCLKQVFGVKKKNVCTGREDNDN